jgi:hypothetical protein
MRGHKKYLPFAILLERSLADGAGVLIDLHHATESLRSLERYRVDQTSKSIRVMNLMRSAPMEAGSCSIEPANQFRGQRSLF